MYHGHIVAIKGYCCERSEQHPILYRGFKSRFFRMGNEPRFCADSLAFVLLNNTTCVTACVTTCVLSRSRHSVLL